MSFLDGVFSEGGADPAIIAAIQTQLTAQQAVINAQQAALDALQATDDAQTTIDALQQAALDAQTALDIVQGAAITAEQAANATQSIAIALAASTNDAQSVRLTALEALLIYSGTVPVSRFVPDWPSTPLTTANFDAALRAAKQWCYDQVVANGKYAFNVGLPAGAWPVAATTLDFPGTYLIAGSPPTPGMIGPGSGQCVLMTQGQLGSQIGALTLGATGSYTVGQVFRGFRVLGESTIGAGIGVGIRAVCTYQLLLEDLRVEGYGRNQHYESGWGVRFDDPGGLDQHQHVTMRSVRVQGCQAGIKFSRIAQLTAEDVWVNQCGWISHVYDGVLGASITGGNLQGADVLADASAGLRWYNRALHPEVTTGWSYTTGLPSGSAATLSATTLATDLDTGIANVGTCIVGGLTSMSIDSVGLWITLQAASGTPYVSDDNVAGIYQIVDYISDTSVRIAKGTTHTAKTGVTWQVRGSKGGNQIALSGFPYHEGARRCVAFFGGGDPQDSQYDLTGVMSYNTMIMIAQRVAQIRLHSAGPYGGKAARLYKVNKFTTDLQADRLVLDGWSRQGTVARANDRYLTAGTWEGARSPATRVRSFVTERGGWAFDPARADKQTLSTLNVTQVRCVQDDAITLAPQYVGSPPALVVSDPGFGGQPCWNLQGGAPGAVRNLAGVIPAAKVPASRYAPTILVVARLPNTTVDAGAQRRMMIRSSDGSRDIQIAYNDGAFHPVGNYYNMYSDVVGAGNAHAQIRTAVDTAPHAHALRYEARALGLIGAGQGVDELSTADHTLGTSVPTAYASFPGNMDLLLWFLYDFGNGNAGLLVRHIAVFPVALGEGEISQYFDYAASEFRMAR